MSLIRVLIAVLGLALTGAIVWASVNSGPLHGSIFDQGGVMLSLPWGAVTMADLYTGFVLFAIVIFLTEKTLLSAILWIFPLFFLGNIWAALWLFIRLPTLALRANRPDGLQP
jgi:hypothetical protein